MNDLSDQQLLRRYAEARSEEAFGTLVRRHVDLVYSAALRMVHDSHLAKDVTQGVFIALAQNAGKLIDHPVLSGWLHRTTQNSAANVIRSDVRRRVREERATAMNELLSAEADAPWEHIAPHLDDALGHLNETDRDALLLRFFERKSAREMAESLGISDQAAQKRVNRAVERLRDLFSKRGLTVGTTALVAVISSSAVKAAPLGLSATISSGAVLSGLALQSTTALTATTKAIIMTTLQKTIIATVIVASIAVPLTLQNRANEKLRNENEALRGQVQEVSQLKAELERLTNLAAQTRDSETLSSAQYSELLKLRGQKSQAQTATRELAALKETVAKENPIANEFLTNAVSNGLGTAEKWKLKEATAKLARMKAKLNLTADQEEAIKAMQTEKIRVETERVMKMMSGKISPEEVQADADAKSSFESEVKALLTPDQLAVYGDYQHSETLLAAREMATHEARTLAEDFQLSPALKAEAYAALYQQQLDFSAKEENKKPTLVIGDGNATTLHYEWQKRMLEEKLQILGSILTPEQLKRYETEKLSEIEQQRQLMNMIMLKKTASAAK